MASISALLTSTPPVGTPYASSVHAEVCRALITELTQLRHAMLEREKTMAPTLARVAPQYLDSARNLVHYLALRSHELRSIQERLAWLGLSSLGRAESHVLANLDKVLGILHCLTGQRWVDQSPQEPVGSVTGRRLLQAHAVRLLGDHPEARPVRIMVTVPSEAAGDYNVVRELVEAGMDVARINCAHDDASDWVAMAHNIRRAAKVAGRNVRILMDLAGPKIRTGDIAPRPAVLRMRPNKDEFGRPYRPYRLGIQAASQTEVFPGVDGCIGVDPKWLAHVEVGTQVDFSDARGAKRHLLVVELTPWGAVAESLQTAYLTPETLLSIHGAQGKKWSSTLASQIEAPPGMWMLHRGDVIRVTAKGLGDPGQVACTLPEVINQVRVGERIWFDDGRIGGIVRNIVDGALEVEITQAREGGEKLTADKGINLPDRGCKNFCVNGPMAGNCCTSKELLKNDRHERTDRQPAG